MAVNLAKNLHQFRHSSELMGESKGGYLEGYILLGDCIDEIAQINLSLVSEHEEPHANLLFVTSTVRKVRTPHGERKKQAKSKDMNPEAFEVTINQTANGNWQLDTNNHKYLEENCVDNLNVSSCFDGNGLEFGRSKLQLTVAKPKQKDSKKSSGLFVQDVLKARGLVGTQLQTTVDEYTKDKKKNALYKVKLQVVAVYKDDTQPSIMFYSETIYDKGKYGWIIDDISPRIICNQGSHCINVMMSVCNATNDMFVDCEFDNTSIEKKGTRKVGQTYRFFIHVKNNAEPSVVNMEVFIRDRNTKLSPDKQTLQMEPHSDDSRCSCRQSLEAVKDNEARLSRKRKGLKVEQQQGEDNKRANVSEDSFLDLELPEHLFNNTDSRYQINAPIPYPTDEINGNVTVETSVTQEGSTGLELIRDANNCDYFPDLIDYVNGPAAELGSEFFDTSTTRWTNDGMESKLSSVENSMQPEEKQITVAAPELDWIEGFVGLVATSGEIDGMERKLSSVEDLMQPEEKQVRVAPSRGRHSDQHSIGIPCSYSWWMVFAQPFFRMAMVILIVGLLS